MTAERDITVDGVDYCVGFEWTVHSYRENYGADADGRRGRMMDMREAYFERFLCIERYDESGMTEFQPGTGALEPATVNAFLANIDAYIDSDDAYRDIQDDDEPDYDDRDD